MQFLSFDFYFGTFEFWLSFRDTSWSDERGLASTGAPTSFTILKEPYLITTKVDTLLTTEPTVRDIHKQVNS